MSKKQHSPEYVAKMILKKAYDVLEATNLVKARADKDLSDDQKKQARTKRFGGLRHVSNKEKGSYINTPEGRTIGQKGVHNPLKTGDYSKEHPFKTGKIAHKKRMAEQSEIKPDLPKSKDMEKGKKLKAYMEKNKDKKVKQAVKKIKTDKHQVQDVLPKVPRHKRDNVLRRLRNKK